MLKSFAQTLPFKSVTDIQKVTQNYFATRKCAYETEDMAW